MWSVNKKWNRFFAIAYTCGFTIASLQTIWIIYELKKGFRKLNKE